jgi:hypothetical protein
VTPERVARELDEILDAKWSGTLYYRYGRDTGVFFVNDGEVVKVILYEKSPHAFKQGREAVETMATWPEGAFSALSRVAGESPPEETISHEERVSRTLCK